LYSYLRKQKNRIEQDETDLNEMQTNDTNTNNSNLSTTTNSSSENSENSDNGEKAGANTKKQEISQKLLEKHITSAYIAVLLAYLVVNNEENKKQVIRALPSHSFADLLTVLNEFVSFQTDNNLATEEDIKQVGSLIQSLKRLEFYRQQEKDIENFAMPSFLLKSK